MTTLTALIRTTLRYRRAGDRDEELFGAWLIVYVLAMVLVALLGVVLESPFGASPFFWVVGVGLAWSRGVGPASDRRMPGIASRPDEVGAARTVGTRG